MTLKFRNIINSVFICFLLLSCSIPREYNDLNDLQLKGKIESLITFKYFPGIPNDSTLVYNDFKRQYFFNNKGYITEVSNFDSKGILENKESYAYKLDRKKRIVEKSSINDYFSGYTFKEKRTCSYDRYGRFISLKCYSNDKLKFILTYKYKGKKNVQTNQYNGDSVLVSTTIVEKYYKAKIAEIVEYDADGILNRRNTYKYDSIGNNIEEIWYVGDSLDRRFVSGFDKKRNEIEVNAYDIYGNLTYQYHAIYDTKGNIITKTDFYPKNKELTTFKYLYDENNNWIEETILKDTIITYIYKREIKYFKK
jgi:hypothetical protein